MEGTDELIVLAAERFVEQLEGDVDLFRAEVLRAGENFRDASAVMRRQRRRHDSG